MSTFNVITLMERREQVVEQRSPFGEAVRRFERAGAYMGEKMAQFQATKDALTRLASEPVIKEAKYAALRTTVNGAIAAIDLVPVIGSVFSMGATAAKMVKRLHQLKKLGKMLPRKPGEPSKADLTPDVPLLVSATLKGVELVVGSWVPLVSMHAIEAALQLRKDWPRMRDGYRRVRDVAAEQLAVLERRQTQDALDVFEQ